jgi:hypothetical protein
MFEPPNGRGCLEPPYFEILTTRLVPKEPARNQAGFAGTAVTLFLKIAYYMPNGKKTGTGRPRAF